MIDLTDLIKESMKSKDQTRLQVYRNLKSKVQQYETSKGAKPLTESIQLEIFNKYAKQLEDSIREFAKAGRDDLFAQYTNELNIVKELLPAPVTGDQIIQFIHTDRFFERYWAQPIPKKDMGACIKYIKEQFPTADGKEISNIIKSMVV